MFLFSPLEALRVALVRPDVRAAIVATANDWMREFPGEKLSVPADGGFRGEGVQARIYADSLAQGFRAAPPGESPHELAAAIDLKIVGVAQNAERDQHDPRYRRLAEIGVSHGLRAGFFFKSGAPDPYDFSANESLETMRAKFVEHKKKLATWLLSPSSSLSSSASPS